MSPFLRAYFSRLGWTGEPDVSIDTLRQLHLQHNSAIPFENLDVLLPREIHLDDGALEEKLIAGRRGGYCFEQNGLLERALREIGFNVRSLLGRVVLANPLTTDQILQDVLVEQQQIAAQDHEYLPKLLQLARDSAA